MPIYGGDPSLYSPSVPSYALYLSSPYSGHSSLIGSYSRPSFSKPLSSRFHRNFAPHLATISENHVTSLRKKYSPRLRIGTPTISIPRPIKINTADIDVSANKYKLQNLRSLPETQEKPKNDEAKPIRRDRATVRLHTVHKEKDKNKKWRQNFNSFELNTDTNNLKKQLEDKELGPETDKENNQEQEEATSNQLPKSPSFHDICRAISTDSINEEQLNPGQPIELVRRQSRSFSSDDLLKQIRRNSAEILKENIEVLDQMLNCEDLNNNEVKKSSKPEETYESRGSVRKRKRIGKKKSQDLKEKIESAQADCQNVPTSLQRRNTRKASTKDISRVEIEEVKRKPKPLFTATVDVEEPKTNLKIRVDDVKVEEKPTIKPKKFKLNVTVQVEEQPKAKKQTGDTGKMYIPNFKPALVTAIKKTEHRGSLGDVCEGIDVTSNNKLSKAKTVNKSKDEDKVAVSEKIGQNETSKEVKSDKESDKKDTKMCDVSLEANVAKNQSKIITNQKQADKNDYLGNEAKKEKAVENKPKLSKTVLGAPNEKTEIVSKTLANNLNNKHADGIHDKHEVINNKTNSDINKNSLDQQIVNNSTNNQKKVVSQQTNSTSSNQVEQNLKKSSGNNLKPARKVPTWNLADKIDEVSEQEEKVDTKKNLKHVKENKENELSSNEGKGIKSAIFEIRKEKSDDNIKEPSQSILKLSKSDENVKSTLAETKNKPKLNLKLPGGLLEKKFKESEIQKADEDKLKHDIKKTESKEAPQTPKRDDVKSIMKTNKDGVNKGYKKSVSIEEKKIEEISPTLPPKEENSSTDFWEVIGNRSSVYESKPIDIKSVPFIRAKDETEPEEPKDEGEKTEESKNEDRPLKLVSKRSLVNKATADDPDLQVFVPPPKPPTPEPQPQAFVPLQSNRLSDWTHPFKKPEQLDECPVEIYATPKNIRKRHFPRPRPTSDTSSDEESTEEEEEEEDGNVGKSTSSNDSGFNSSTGRRNRKDKDCDVNIHRKCEKLTANLCGINQKLIVEAIESVRKAPSDTRDSPTSNPAHNPAFALDACDGIEEFQMSSTYAGFQKSGRITPPATTIPRFRKYTIDDFNFLKVLGKGSFGKVLLAELKDTEYYYAIKCLKKDVVLEDDDVECTLIERKVLALGTKHPYLCHLLCTFQTESHLFFVMEYLNGGDLMFHIQMSGRFVEPRARFYGAEIVSGLKFLHTKGIVYRDLKLDNVLLDFDGHVRIADFGMCKLQIFLDRMADTFCGTPDYMAPEIIKGQHYNQCVDWWSFGVLLYEMLIGQSPFSGCDEDELFWSICNEKPVFPRFLSAEANSVLTQLLEKDWNKRLGNKLSPHGEIQDHSFFRPIAWDLLEMRQLEAPFKPNLQHPLDTQYFDKTFTVEKAKLTPIDKNILQSMDQTQFQGFSYTNPNATDR